MGGAVQFQRSRTFVERCAGGHDIVDEQDALTGEIGRAMESIADIFNALFPGQGGLRRRVANALTMAAVKWQAQGFGQRTRQLERLAKRAVLGLARTGASMSNGSGDYVIAFSSAPSVRRTCSNCSRPGRWPTPYPAPRPRPSRPP